MSGTTTPTGTTTSETAKPAEPLLTAQFIVALYALTILAATIAGVMLIKDLTPLQGTVAGSVVSGALTGVLGFYFGSSKGSQTKDVTNAQMLLTPTPGTTTTTPQGNPHA